MKREEDTEKNAEESGMLGSLTSESYWSDRVPSYRELYDILRTEIKLRSTSFQWLERQLGQARIPLTYDKYLTRAIKRAVLGMLLVFVILLSIILGISRQMIGIESLQQSIDSSPWMTGGLIVLLTIVVGVVIIFSYVVYPWFKAYLRGRRIERTLPHALIFMYALSNEGVPLVEIMGELADAEDVYGEVSAEFEGIAVDVKRFNLDLLTALEEGQRLTPSDDFREVLSNLTGVLESGGSLDRFLRDTTESQLTLARQRQENFLGTLATLAEAYVTLIFFGPILLTVVLIVMSFSGAETVFAVQLLTYVGVPVGILSSIAVIGILDTRQGVAATIEIRGVDPEVYGDIEDSKLASFHRQKRRKSIVRRLRQPLQTLQERPSRSLFISVPLMGFLLFSLVKVGVVTPTFDAYRTRPLWTTTWLFVFPFFLPSLGLMTSYELKRRRVEDVKRRFPDVLKTLASANKNGIQLVDSISLTRRRSGGVLSQELEKLDRDIRVSGSVHDALRRFAEDVGVPRVVHVTKILIEGDKSSENLSKVLEIAAEDVRERHRLEQDRKQAMHAYTVVFLVGIGVYLLIVVVLNRFFFPAVSQISVESGSSGADIGGLDSSIPISAYRTVLYHSSLIQSVGNGLLIGKLVENDVIGGLKYVNALILLVLLAFLLS